MSVIWDKLCRLCANIDNSNSFLFNCDGEKKGILQFVEKFLRISISSDDGLPSKVCEDCSNKVIEFQNYSVQCDKIQEFFKKYNQTQVEVFDNEHLRSLKSEFMFETTANIEIKKEINENSVDYNMDDDDMDYLPLSDLVDVKKFSPDTNSKPVKKKRGRPKKQNANVEESAIEDKKIYTDLNPLITNHEEKNNGIDNETKVQRERKTKVKQNETKKSKLNERMEFSFDGRANIFKFTCHVCEKEFSNWNALKVHTKRTHKCSAKVLCVCLKQLSSRKSLLQHIARHSPEKGFKCNQCDKAYGYKRDLDNHLLQHIPKEELPFVCCKCAKRFTTARILKVHEKIHRPREERFIHPCDLCEHKFATKGALTNHKRVIHEKLKPFVCDLCGNAFSTKANMEEHRTRHMDIKNFVCNDCNKSFKTKGALVRHMDTHSDTAYQCPHCPMLLNSRRTLRNHLFVHDDTQSHVCPFCGKAFKRRKECKSHLKLHTGERPYTCPWCPRSFTNGSNCRIHKRRMHPQEFAEEETTNPYAPSTTSKPEPKKIIHASFRNPEIEKIMKNKSLSNKDTTENEKVSSDDDDDVE